MDRYNITVYNEPAMIKAIQEYQKKEEINHFTNAATKLIKKALRAEGLLKELN